MLKGKSIGKPSGMSKLSDARKRQAPPIQGGKVETTLQKVSGAGRSKLGAPTKNARKVQPAAAKEAPYEATMMGKGKKR